MWISCIHVPPPPDVVSLYIVSGAKESPKKKLEKETTHSGEVGAPTLRRLQMWMRISDLKGTSGSKSRVKNGVF
jgi:hypothetical protein